MPTKDILNALHDLVHKCLHFALIPVMAVLDGIIALLERFRTELAKF